VFAKQIQLDRPQRLVRHRIWCAEHVAAFWSGIVVAAMVIRFPQIELLQFFAEAGAYLLVLLWLTQAALLRPVIEKAHRGQRLLAALLIGVLLLGQLAGQQWGLFPAVRWDMYTREEGSSQFSFLAYEAEHASGRRTAFNPAHAAKSLNENRLVTKFQSLHLEALHYDTLAPGGGSRFEQMLISLARLKNETLDDPIMAISVYECGFDIEQGPDDGRLRRELLATYEVEKGMGGWGRSRRLSPQQATVWGLPLVDPSHPSRLGHSATVSQRAEAQP